jgi:para-nitrobenzyl esterase
MVTRRAGITLALGALLVSVLIAFTPALAGGPTPSQGPAVTSESATAPTVQTTEGPVIGVQETGLQVFRGIPYAARPVGALRFMPPVPHAPWTEPRPATDKAPVCVQSPYYDPTDPGRKVSVQSENCLTLNVWTPRANRQARPVMVWIHGGAFLGGGCRNPWYDGSALARRGDEVIVCIQYRLGVFGFSELSQLDKTFAGGGNAGMLDMVAALEWVQDNIAGFGGDPNNVTIFGESAGGEAVHLLMGMPQASGLFQKAISQSGILSGAAWPKSYSIGQTTRMMKLAGVSSVKQLQAIPAQKLQGICDWSVFQWPHLDGVVFTKSADEVIRAGDGAQVPLLIGTNLDEIRYWTALDARPGDETVTGPVMWANVFGNEKHMTKYFGTRADSVIATYRRDYGTRYDEVVNFLSDGNFRIGAIRFAREQGSFAPVYMYQFIYRSPVEGRTGKVVGACHSMELPFVFGTAPARVEDVTGPSSGWGDLQERMMDAWLAFARTGDPSTPTLAWPVYDTQGRTTMLLGPTSGVVDDPHSAERRAWAHTPFELLPYPIPFAV